MRKEQQEMIARFFHEGTWGRWMKYQKSLEVGRHYYGDDIGEVAITHKTINIERWDRQMDTDYEDLTQREKDSDRSIANDFRKYLTEHGYEIRKKKEVDGIGFIDQDDPQTQKHIKDSFEDTLMYLNTIDPDDLPTELKEELMRLSERIREDCW